MSDGIGAARCVAIMVYYLIKICFPGEIFLKNYLAKILHRAPRESLSLGIRNTPGLVDTCQAPNLRA